MSRTRSNLLWRLCLLGGTTLLPFAGGVGCGPSGTIKNLPADAAPMATGRSTTAFVATRPGEVYVADQTADRILYRRRLKTGDTMEVRSSDDLILYNSKTVTDRDLDPSHIFQIYFKPDQP
jgi:hypothetical protein